MNRALPLLLLLSACTAHVSTSNSRGGIIKAPLGPDGYKQAAELADAECRKFNRVSVVKSRNEWNKTLRYECVEP